MTRAVQVIFLWLLALPTLGGEAWQDPATIREAAVRFVLAQAEPRVRYEVNIEQLDARVRLKRCSQPLDVQGGNGFRPGSNVTLAIRCTDAQAWLIHVPVRIRAFRPVVVLKNAVLRGATLRPTDVETREFDVSGFAAGYLADTDLAIGKIAKRSLAVGTVLAPSHLKPPHLVRRGDTVTVLLNNGGLQIRAQAQALGDGGENERVRARNIATGKIIDGTVIGPGLLRIHM